MHLSLSTLSCCSRSRLNLTIGLSGGGGGWLAVDPLGCQASLLHEAAGKPELILMLLLLLLNELLLLGG